MKTLKHIMVATLCAVVLTGCDDFLTTPPLDQITEDDWWKDAKQAQMIVDGCYDYVYQGDGDNIIAFRDAWTDNSTWWGLEHFANGDLRPTSRGLIDEWKFNSTFNEGKWTYSPIAEMNYILQGLELSKEYVTPEQYAHMCAEVRFIRALNYYDMLFFFGDIPLVDKMLTVDESRELIRTPRADVYEFVINELEECLVDIKKAPNFESGRVTEDVVNAMIARVSLHEAAKSKYISFLKNSEESTENLYKRVLTATQAIIDGGRYGLYRGYDGDPKKHSYEELFRPQADGNNNEVIFERQYYPSLKTHSMNNNLSYPSSVYCGWKGLLPLQSIVDEYECIEGHPYDQCEALNCPHVAERAALDQAGMLSYGEYEFRDPRLKSTIIHPGWEWMKGGKVDSHYGVEDPDSRDYIGKEPVSTGFLLTKWTDLEGEEPDRWLGHKNITIFRYADILLMRAEALIELNENLGEALSLINDVRNRAEMPEYPAVTSQSDMIAKLRHERRVETAFEGLRYYDIVRWGIAPKVLNGPAYGWKRWNPETQKHDNPLIFEQRIWADVQGRYFWPIPQASIDQNENIKQQDDKWWLH